MSGKGSRQRKKQISEEEMEKNWARLFPKKPRKNTKAKRYHMNQLMETKNGT